MRSVGVVVSLYSTSPAYEVELWDEHEWIECVKDFLSPEHKGSDTL